MSRKKTKKFDYAEGIYYFGIKKGFNNNIVIKRNSKKNALLAFNNYLKIYKDKCEWYGKWNGSKFTEDNFDKLAKAEAAIA